MESKKTAGKKQILNISRKYAALKGLVLNPDSKIVDVVITGLFNNQEKYKIRYCPCFRVLYDKEKDRICPCRQSKEELEKQGYCHCMLFFTKEKADYSKE
jgi:ferredoxin-thioredoxin reductase catalytic subunit